MKYLILIPDGAADYPVEALHGKTILEAAKIPAMDSLAVKSLCGAVKTIPEGMPAGSDVASLSILGYDPKIYYTGRGPLEAAYHEINVSKDTTIFRCNLVTVKEGRIIDYSAGHISNAEAGELIGFLDQVIDGIEFFTGVSYRNLATIEGDFEGMRFYPPHDVLGQDIEDILPKGKSEKFFKDLYRESKNLLSNYKVNTAREAEGKNPANMIWLWGPGKDKKLPSFESEHHIKGTVISAVDLLKGIAKKAGMEVVEVPGATGDIDTDYEGKVSAAIDSLKENDLVLVHVEATDEAGHSGDDQLKIKAVQEFDRRMVKPLLEKLGDIDYKMLIMPDHLTPVSLRTHTSEPVPFIVYDNKRPQESIAKSFSEHQLAKSGLLVTDGYKLVNEYLFVWWILRYRSG